MDTITTNNHTGQLRDVSISSFEMCKFNINTITVLFHLKEDTIESRCLILLEKAIEAWTFSSIGSIKCNETKTKRWIEFFYYTCHSVLPSCFCTMPGASLWINRGAQWLVDWHNMRRGCLTGTVHRPQASCESYLAGHPRLSPSDISRQGGGNRSRKSGVPVEILVHWRLE